MRHRVICCATTTNILKKNLLNLLSLTFLPLKFCRWTLLEAGRALFMKRLKENKQGFTGKSRTLTHFVAFEEHMANKAILSVSQNRREVSC